MKKLTKVLILIAITILLVSCSSANNRSVATNISGFYFDTYISISIYDSMDDNTLQGLTDLLNKYDTLFSEDNENSDIYKLNHSKSSSLALDAETVHVLSNALEFSAKTGGAFDPSIQSVQKLWCFDGSNNIPPNDAAINEAIKHIDHTAIKIEDFTVSLLENQEITLGASAKGYIADQIRKYLYDNNINNALIDLGGNILCMGSKLSNNKPESFVVGIKKPFSDEAAYTLNVTDLSIVTSGVYERSFTYNGRLYHHILDSATGYPVALSNNNGQELYGVTIIGASSEICDNLSTCLLILGQEKGEELLLDYPGYEALFLYDDCSICKTDGFDKALNHASLDKEKIMLLGDSITYGYCPDHASGGFRNVLSELLVNSSKQDKYDFVGSINEGTGYDNDCCGFSGVTISDYKSDNPEYKDRKGLDRLAAWSAYTYYPDTIFLMIGTNDILVNNDINTMNAQIEELIDQLLIYAKNNKTIYVASIPYVDANTICTTEACSQKAVNERVDSYNQHIREYVNKCFNENHKIYFIDINSCISIQDLADGIHPDPDGYKKMGNYIFDSIFKEK